MSYADTIYQTALTGTVNSAGLPPTLAALVVAQAKHETGNFSSPIFLNQNNAFGYSYFSGSPYQIGSGVVADNGLKTAKYANVADSTREIVDWIGRRSRDGRFPADLSTIQTPADYAALLKQNGYFTDSLSNYANGLARFFTVPVVVGSTLVLVSLAVLIFLVARKKK